MAIKRLLVPVDFSPASIQALDYAALFGERFKAEVIVLFVVETLYHAEDLGLFVEEQQRSGREQLSRLEAQLRQRGVKCRTLLRIGVPHQVITAEAERQNADLIVMGTHGRTGLSHLLMGSVADKVVRTASRPVLTARASARARTILSRRRKTR